MSTSSIEPDRDQAIREHLRAIEALLDGEGSKEAVNSAPTDDDHWPPDPATINLRDGTWWSSSEAAYELRCSEDTMLRRAKSEPIAIQIGTKWWFKRSRASRNLRDLRS